MARRDKVAAGSGDVFVDLGFKDADERRLRVQLAIRVNDLIAQRRLTLARAAERFDISQRALSQLRNYKLSRFSAGRLLHFLVQLDRDVEIVIRPKANRGAGHLSVSVV